MVYGALSSTWPVSTGVLVCEGVAYFGAGIVDHDGTYLYALDAVTGRIQWQNGTSGHLDPTLRKGVSVQGQLAVAGGRLWLAGGNVISPAPYDLRTGQYVGPGPGDGSPRSNRGSEIGVLTEKHIILGGRLLYSARENVVNPGSFVAIDISAGPRGGSQMPVGTGKILPAWDGRRLVMLAGPRSVPFAYASSAVERHLAEGEPRSRPEPLWTAGWAGGTDTVAIALAGDSVVTVAEVPRPRSLASDWRVRVLGAEDGAMHWERGLPGAAATGGLLVDRNGRIVVCLEDGRVVCLGARRSSP
jgi:outer membrane protein assembly factor BamB